MTKSYNKFLASTATAALVASALIPVASADTVGSTTSSDNTADQTATTSGTSTTSSTVAVETTTASTVDVTTAPTVEVTTPSTVDVTTPSTVDVTTSPVVTVTTPPVVDVDVTTAPAVNVHTFKDVNKNYNNAVSYLFSNGIVKGKSSTNFGINMGLTRGDAAVILAGALGLDVENAKDAGFKDLNSRIEGAVNALAEAGIIAKADKFNPNALLTRGAMAKLLVEGYDLQGNGKKSPFVDAVGAFGSYINTLYGEEITNGKTTTTFGTNLTITRGEFANLLYRTLKK